MSTGPSTKRLFFALWPDDATREHLAAQARLVVSKIWAGRVVAEENLHVTLVFLGEIDQRREQCAREAAAGVAAESFELVLDQRGYWPKPKVVWVGAKDVPSSLMSLHSQLSVGLQACGFQPEARPFAPHITLMRKVLRRPPALGAGSYTWKVENFHLVQSTLCAGGVQYALLASWPLRRPV